MDPHHPYYPPREALSALGDSRITDRRARFLNSFWNRDVSTRRSQPYRDEIISLYDAGIYWVDKQIARLVRSLQQLKKWDDTVLAVTADHGEEFLEHGNRYHSPTNLLDPLIRVPLLVRAPDTSAARLPEPFSLINLAPTLFEAVGAPLPENFQGRSHWQEIASGTLSNKTAIIECIGACNNPFQSENRMHSRLMSVRDSIYKLVLNFDEKKDWLFDLKNDPGEDSPLPVGALPQERARLLRVALTHIRAMQQSRDPSLRLRTRLRDLEQAIEKRTRVRKPSNDSVSSLAG
jgi:arylsulfatase A-like enzyme